jgi:hypothetical protein
MAGNPPNLRYSLNASVVDRCSTPRSSFENSMYSTKDKVFIPISIYLPESNVEISDESNLEFEPVR